MTWRIRAFRSITSAVSATVQHTKQENKGQLAPIVCQNAFNFFVSVIVSCQSSSVRLTSPRIFTILSRLCDSLFCFRLFLFTSRLFLLSNCLPLRNYTRQIRQNLIGSVWRKRLNCLTEHYDCCFFSDDAELTLLSVSLYCCTNSPIESGVYPCKLCLSDFSMSCSMFWAALFRMKFTVDRVVSCAAVLESCRIKDI